jgi:hypothetical protein
MLELLKKRNTIVSHTNVDHGDDASLTQTDSSSTHDLKNELFILRGQKRYKYLPGIEQCT